MSAPHVIETLTLDWTFQAGAEARECEARMARFAREQAVSVIAGVMDEFQDGNRVHQLDLLEVEMGHGPPHEGLAETAARLRAAMRQALSEALGRHGNRRHAMPGSAKVSSRSNEEVLWYELHHGHLPWQAAHLDAFGFDRLVAKVLRDNGPAFVWQAVTSPAGPRLLARAVRQWAPDNVRQLGHLLADAGFPGWPVAASGGAWTEFDGERRAAGPPTGATQSGESETDTLVFARRLANARLEPLSWSRLWRGEPGYVRSVLFRHLASPAWRARFAENLSTEHWLDILGLWCTTEDAACIASVTDVADAWRLGGAEDGSSLVAQLRSAMLVRLRQAGAAERQNTPKIGLLTALAVMIHARSETTNRTPPELARSLSADWAMRTRPGHTWLRPARVLAAIAAAPMGADQAVEAEWVAFADDLARAELRPNFWRHLRQQDPGRMVAVLRLWGHSAAWRLRFSAALTAEQWQDILTLWFRPDVTARLLALLGANPAAAATREDIGAALLTQLCLDPPFSLDGDAILARLAAEHVRGDGTPLPPGATDRNDGRAGPNRAEQMAAAGMAWIDRLDEDGRRDLLRRNWPAAADSILRTIEHLVRSLDLHGLAPWGETAARFTWRFVLHDLQEDGYEFELAGFVARWFAALRARTAAGSAITWLEWVTGKPAETSLEGAAEDAPDTNRTAFVGEALRQALRWIKTVTAGSEPGMNRDAFASWLADARLEPASWSGLRRHQPAYVRAMLLRHLASPSWRDRFAANLTTEHWLDVVGLWYAADDAACIASVTDTADAWPLEDSEAGATLVTGLRSAMLDFVSNADAHRGAQEPAAGMFTALAALVDALSGRARLSPPLLARALAADWARRARGDGAWLRSARVIEGMAAAPSDADTALAAIWIEFADDLARAELRPSLWRRLLHQDPARVVALLRLSGQSASWLARFAAALTPGQWQEVLSLWFQPDATARFLALLDLQPVPGRQPAAPHANIGTALLMNLCRDAPFRLNGEAIHARLAAERAGARTSPLPSAAIDRADEPAGPNDAEPTDAAGLAWIDRLDDDGRRDLLRRRRPHVADRISQAITHLVRLLDLHGLAPEGETAARFTWRFVLHDVQEEGRDFELAGFVARWFAALLARARPGSAVTWLARVTARPAAADAGAAWRPPVEGSDIWSRLGAPPSQVLAARLIEHGQDPVWRQWLAATMTEAEWREILAPWATPDEAEQILLLIRVRKSVTPETDPTGRPANAEASGALPDYDGADLHAELAETLMQHLFTQGRDRIELGDLTTRFVMDYATLARRSPEEAAARMIRSAAMPEAGRVRSILQEMLSRDTTQVAADAQRFPASTDTAPLGDMVRHHSHSAAANGDDGPPPGTNLELARAFLALGSAPDRPDGQAAAWLERMPNQPDERLTRLLSDLLVPPETGLARLAPLDEDQRRTLLRRLRPDDAPKVLAAVDHLLISRPAPPGAEPSANLAWRFILHELFDQRRSFDAQGLAARWFATTAPVPPRTAPSPAAPGITLAAVVRALAACPPPPARETAEAAALPASSVPLWPEPAVGETIYIHNAGLVLVAVYLPPLFDRLGLTRERTFIDAEAADRAARLLQFLADGMENGLEHTMVLNKVLCGLAMEVPLLRGIDVSETERETIGGLLQAVIERWSAVGKTSVAGLRGSFLCRDGALTREDDAWRLRVEPRGWDVLLSQIPWGFRTVKLPWMEQVLHVDWR